MNFRNLNIILILLISLNAKGQRVIYGNILDENSTAFPGVIIVERGTNSGTISGIDGSFRYTTNTDTSCIVLSFIRYKDSLICDFSKLPLTIQLEPIIYNLEDLVYVNWQFPDYLVVDNDTIAIFANPLEQYFKKVGNREIIGLKNCGSNACLRGYKAIWKLKNDSLFLTAITSCHSGDLCADIRDADLDLMFGDDYKNNSVFASWFTGDIMVPKGELVQYMYGSIYEEEQYFTFEKGIKIKERTKSNKKIADEIRFHKKEMEVSKQVQDTLFYFVKKNVSWDTITTPWFMLCDEKYILTYNRRGKIKKTWVWEYWEYVTFRKKIDDWWWNNTYHRKCRMIIKKAIKPLRLSYLDLPRKRFKITFQIFYDRKTGKLELWKEYWMERE